MDFAKHASVITYCTNTRKGSDLSEDSVMRAFAYKVILMLCAAAFGLVVIATLGVIAMPSIIALLVDRKQEVVDLKKLRELGDRQTVPVRQILNKPVEVVCALGIYQRRVDDDGPLRERVNALLKNASFGFPGKGTWFLALVFGDSVTVQQVNALPDQLYLARDGAGLPSTFKPVECATIDRARIMKVREAVVVLGEER